MPEVTLIGANGDQHTLACDPISEYQLGTSSQLHGLAPYAHISRRVATIPGERVEAVRAEPRTFRAPVVITGTSQEIDDRIAALGRLLSPKDDVRVVYRRDDGTSREISARYLQGGDALNIAHKDTPGIKVPLIFRAYWPYWRSTTNTLQQVGPTTFNDGFFGFSNAFDVTNNGDVDTWPEFIIDGHSESIEMMNVSLGQMWRIKRIIEPGDELEVFTDPRIFGVYINAAEQYSAVDTVSTFWPLRPGTNQPIFRANSDVGAPGIGSFLMRWRELFETC